MTCVQHCYGAHGAREKRRQLFEAAGVRDQLKSALDQGPKVLSGTWDFKWPRGTLLRVAFQRLPDDVPDHDELMRWGTSKTVEKFDAWLRSDKYAPNLDYTIVGDLPPPLRRPSEDEPWAAKSGGTPANGYLADGRRGEVGYDILISFLPLPVVLPRTEQHPEQAVVGTSATELGRYSRRIEYGVPTMYLGAWSGFSVRQWMASPEGEFAIVHEIGHALGMPHEQQNPLIDEDFLPWKDEAEIRRILMGRPGLSPGMDPMDFFEDEIKGRWPGELRFSDWRKPAAQPDKYDFDSVMAKPSYQCLLLGVHPEKDCTPAGCEHLQNALRALAMPTESDLEHLITMYGENPGEPPRSSIANGETLDKTKRMLKDDTVVAATS
jgi:hypothetical protein